MAARDGAPPLAKRARKRPVFVDTEYVEAFENQHIVSVDGPWEVLLQHLEEDRIALIRAPPKSGKSLLGKLAAAGRVEVLKGTYEVRYVNKLGNVEQYLSQWKFNNVMEMAEASGASWADPERKNVIYYFDEVDVIPEDVNTNFISNKSGYAVFASTGTAYRPQTYETPKGLLQHTFVYRSPADRNGVGEWLGGRIRVLFGEAGGTVDEGEVGLMTELLMNLSGGHVGILQHIGCYFETHATNKDFQEVRDCLATMVRKKVPIARSRCFGVANGPPDPAQAVLISSVRCCGRTAMVNALGVEREAFDLDNQLHRRGLSQAYYAIADDGAGPIGKVDADQETLSCTFVHSLQPELYEWKQVDERWASQESKSRWLVDFAHSVGEPAATPENVVDLVTSWLAHTSTEDLLNAHTNLDVAENFFQNSFNTFLRDQLGLKGQKEVPARWADGTFSGYLDHLVESTMGVEFLIRKSAENRFNVKNLLTGQTKRSLIDHAARSNEKTAKAHAQASYADVAAQCTKGYITVLVATVTTTTAETEYRRFTALIDELRRNQADAPILKHSIMVAVARFGWAAWDVFLWDPKLGKCVRFEIQRQRLMYKIVDGKAVIARHFYPKPTQVWVQKLVREGDGILKLKGHAFEVKPEKDSIAAAKEAVKEKKQSLKCDADELTIYSQCRTGVWKEEEEDNVLYENTEARPYGFVVPIAAV